MPKRVLWVLDGSSVHWLCVDVRPCRLKHITGKMKEMDFMQFYADKCRSTMSFLASSAHTARNIRQVISKWDISRSVCAMLFVLAVFRWRRFRRLHFRLHAR